MPDLDQVLELKFSLLKFLHPTSLLLSQTQQICGPFPTTLSIAFDVSIQRISLITFKRFGIFYDLHDVFSTMTKRAELCKNYSPCIIKGVLHPRPVFWLFIHFAQKLQHIGNK